MLNRAKRSEIEAPWPNGIAKPLDERGTGRIKTLRVGTVEYDGRRDLCMIRSISDGGLMLHVYAPIKVAQSVVVELKCGHRLLGTIEWVEGSNAGMRFDEPVDIVAILASQVDPSRGMAPRIPRVERACPAKVRIGGQVHQLTTINISQGGVRVRTAAPLPTAVDAVVTIDGLDPIRGRLLWCQDGIAGIAFNHTIALTDLVAWLQRG